MRNLAAIIILLAVLGGAVYLYGTENVLTVFSPTQCLKDTERAVYEVLEEGRPGRVRVSVVDTVASTTVWSKDIVHPTPDIVSPIHLGNCAFYAPQSLNYDWEERKIQPGYSFEIWRFSYFVDVGERVVVASENLTGDTNDTQRYFSGTTFSVDPSEKYISLERSYLGESDYALVIKNIKTGEDVFELPLKDVIKKYPSAAGSFDVGSWHETPDGTYLDTETYDGSRIGAQILIRRDTWDVEILPTPDDYLPGVERRGYPLSPYWAYSDVIVWAGGVQEVQDALLEEALAEGRKKHLIVANLRTGERTILETVPIVRGHRFNLVWLDEHTLQYIMPDGTVRKFVTD